MRFNAVTVNNIGGLVDQRIELPTTPLVALAGPNGTGKTKLLAAMIGLWINSIPTPRNGTTASVSLEMALSVDDRQALSQFHIDRFGSEGPPVPELVTITTTRSVIAGNRRDVVPHHQAVESFVDNREFMQQNSSLNPMYLPPERRLLPSRDSTVDFAQLGREMAFAQTQNSRAATQNYGLMDDEEFERFAMALCMADTLPDESGEEPAQPLSRIGWPEFRETINELLHPKELMPMSKAFADHLRIRLPNGDIHRVADLSSGERQALIIISRVLRAGAGHSVVLIDEPDAHLHPNLSLRLMQALQRGRESPANSSSQLIAHRFSTAFRLIRFFVWITRNQRPRLPRSRI